MLRRTQIIAAAATVAAFAAIASAAPTLDGALDAAYGGPKAVQSVGTQFGNANAGNSVSANGSELNNAYGVVEGGVLYLFLGGNLESNFNKLELFFDSVAGGQNKLRGDNPDVDFNGLNRMGDDGSGNGLRFDAGFEADAYLMLTNGNTGSGIQYFANYAQILSAGGGTGAFVGGSDVGQTSITGGNGINIVTNNSNVGGVGSFGNPNDSDPALVGTGMELAIPLSLLGDPTGDIRITAFINGGGHDFASNQFLGGLPGGTANLGEPRSVDLSQQAGDQFFVVAVPEPATMGLAALGVAALGLRRRRQ